VSRLLYLDASAIVKLIRPEPESSALLASLGQWRERVTSALSALEVRRALRRVKATDSDWRRAEEALRRVGQIGIGEAILTAAAKLEPPELRTLDSIHLATALLLGKELGALTTYDRRLQQAGRALGLEVLSPA
jgi:predicted nucleic acid-binding protein